MLVLAVTLHNIPREWRGGRGLRGPLADNGTITMAGRWLWQRHRHRHPEFPGGGDHFLPLGRPRGKGTKLCLRHAGDRGAHRRGIMLALSDFSARRFALYAVLRRRHMVYVVVEELIPESAEGDHSNIGTIGFAVGFVVMMILDVALG